MPAMKTATYKGHRPVQDPKTKYCQCNVGTEEKPRSCGQILKPVDEYDLLWKCRAHGEMYA